MSVFVSDACDGLAMVVPEYSLKYRKQSNSQGPGDSQCSRIPNGAWIGEPPQLGLQNKVRSTLRERGGSVCLSTSSFVVSGVVGGGLEE